MKKLLALCLTVVLCLCCLASCGSAHEENTWFSEEKLTNCLVGDLPTIEKDYVNHNGEDIYVSFTDSEFKAYVKSVYDYLCSEEYKYLGTRGEQKNTLAGAFTTYYFEPATELESFRVLEGDYVFVFSDGSTDENGDVEFIILVIYDVSTNTLEYGNKKFTYNTQISLRRGSEAPLGGFYVLKEEEHEHTGEWHTSESTHYYQYTCGCPSPDIAELHSDYDENFICDTCGYVMPEHEHTGKWYKNETIHFYEYTCGCENQDIAELHSDYDENFICDICEYVMNGHEHTYEYNHDDIGHGWSYTCGCMTPPNFAQHFDGDGDGKCDEDSCGYDMS